ncbi:MAG: pirin family protein [Gammaproteobacteria bacterium]|nr:pirin family protein [Gammaproteobacteria bacterium]
MLAVRKSEERGHVDLGWLHSRHTFSFGGYHDPRHMGVSALRVINEDRVQPGAGFDTHGHRDMEIISFVRRGSIEHRDSMGNVERLPAGEFQLMSAGTGITHSEYNPSSEETLEFLQVWVLPAQRGLTPGYQQKRFDTEQALTLIASPDAREQSLQIHQDACLYHVAAAAGRHVRMNLEPGRSAYVHVYDGEMTVNGQALLAGDGLTVRDEPAIEAAGPDGRALLFDLP